MCTSTWPPVSTRAKVRCSAWRYSRSLVKHHGVTYFQPIGEALQRAKIRNPNLLNPAHAWALRGPLWNYSQWMLKQMLPKRRAALPSMPSALRGHAEFASHWLQRSPKEISGVMRKHQLKLADRQCRIADLSQRVQDAVVMLCTSLYAARLEDELAHAAADVLCQDLRRRLEGGRPTDRYFRAVTELGEAIAEGNLKSIAGLQPDEILMPYER